MEAVIVEKSWVLVFGLQRSKRNQKHSVIPAIKEILTGGKKSKGLCRRILVPAWKAHLWPHGIYISRRKRMTVLH